MTTAELDTAMLDEMAETSDNYSFNETTRYRILNRAYRHVCRNSWITWRGGSTWSISENDETFDLTSSDCLNLAAGHDVLDVVRCYYLVSGITQHDLVKRTLAEIKAMRKKITDPGYYPNRYAFYRYDSSGTKKAYMDIYPAAQDSGKNILFIDWLEKAPDLSASQNPITPTYADDCIAKFAAGFALESLRDSNAAIKLAEAKAELRDVRGQSYKETSGYIHMGIAL